MNEIDIKYTLSANNLHITNSAFISKHDFYNILNDIYMFDSTPTEVFHRDTWSLMSEWAVHNLCYRIGYKRERTKDVDLNNPCKYEWLYLMLGGIAWLFIK